MQDQSAKDSLTGTERHSASNGDDPPPASSWRRNAHKIGVLCFWILILGGYQWYARSHGLSPLDTLRRLVGVLAGTAVGPLLFIVIYAVRPLVLFPATVLTLGAGLLFGPLFGVIYTIIGSNISALVAYAVGRYFAGTAPGSLLPDNKAGGLLGRYTDRLRSESFATVLTMRFLFLPYDLVNYVAGFLRIDWKAFLLATALGSLPGTVAVVLAGASLHGDFSRGLPGFDWRVFAVSAMIFVASLVLLRWVKRRGEAGPDTTSEGQSESTTSDAKG